MTPSEMYLKIVCAAAPAFAAKDNNLVAAQQNADSLARGCVDMCSKLGLFAAAPPAPTAQPQPQPMQGLAPAPMQVVAPQAQPVQQQAVASFPQDPPQQQAAPAPLPPLAPQVQAGQAPPPPVPFPQATPAPQATGVGGIPQAPVAMGEGQLATPAQPQTIGGTQVVPPAGQTYAPPNQAGVQNTVVQTSTPQGHSALGSGGVISPVIQKPTGPEMIVNPGGQAVIQGGTVPQAVQEQIVR